MGARAAHLRKSAVHDIGEHETKAKNGPLAGPVGKVNTCHQMESDTASHCMDALHDGGHHMHEDGGYHAGDGGTHHSDGGG